MTAMNVTDAAVSRPTHLQSALNAWRAELGAEYVSVAPDTLRDAATATFATSAEVLGVLRPATREQVQACVRIASQFGVALYPVSTGNNWGYGSSVPVRTSALLDLGRMNRILDYDEELAFVTVEPGVTQRQLHAFLRERNSPLWMDATGSSPDCSIIGNTLERGFGHTPMGDHCGTASGYGVVLPTGEYIETGFSRFAGTGKTPAMSRWGVGPSLDGLFSQSNLGIVTRMSVWLMPKPAYFQAFFFATNSPEGLGPIIDALRPLRLSGTLRSVMHIGNDYKVAAATTRFPWSSPAGARGVLDPPAMADLRRELSIGCWNGSGGLYGTRAQVKAARDLLRQALRGKVDRLQFVDDRLIGVMKRFAGPFRMFTGWDVSRTLSLLAPVYGLIQGDPTDTALNSAYWRKRMDVPASPDPDRDRCGLLWCSPMIPATGPHAQRATGLASEVLLAHGFEPQISLSVATERSLIAIITIGFDREVAGEDQRAERCYHDLMRRLLAEGYPPYRLQVGGMQYLDGGDAAYGNALLSIKQAFDPAGILAPGRYMPPA